MKFKNTEIELYIDIDDKVITTIQEIGLQHYPKEFGGILIGNYSEDKKTVTIADTILPKSYKSSKYSFERGSEGLKDQLFKLYHSDTPQIYVGEWHTHPDTKPLPSGTDVNALTQIVNHSEVNISSPVMLIVGLGPDYLELGFYVHFKNKIYRYEND
ncbi:MAG: Mov34/MPN/PAD-1 family protein [Mucilaginibacter sp.]